MLILHILNILYLFLEDNMMQDLLMMILPCAMLF